MLQPVKTERSSIASAAWASSDRNLAGNRNRLDLPTNGTNEG